jgi:hypothetical protein
MCWRWQKMSLEELIAEQAEINAAIEEKRSARREAFKAEMEKKASELGVDLQTLFGGKKRKGANGMRLL